MGGEGYVSQNQGPSKSHISQSPRVLDIGGRIPPPSECPLATLWPAFRNTSKSPQLNLLLGLRSACSPSLLPGP